MTYDLCNENVYIAKISKPPDGKFTISTALGSAFSQAELRQELMAKHPAALVSDLMYRVSRLI